MRHRLFISFQGCSHYVILNRCIIWALKCRCTHWSQGLFASMNCFVKLMNVECLIFLIESVRVGDVIKMVRPWWGSNGMHRFVLMRYDGKSLMEGYEGRRIKSSPTQPLERLAIHSHQIFLSPFHQGVPFHLCKNNWHLRHGNRVFSLWLHPD